MRIIAGSARGRTLRTLQGQKTRPTADRVRESLFNILGQTLSGLTILDLFAGSGAIGLEAISRGASLAVFVDQAPEACRVVRQNASDFGFLPQVEIHCRDVAGAIEIASKKARTFSIVFADPPYDRGIAKRVLVRIGDASILEADGILVIEHSKREDLPEKVGTLRLGRRETYGDTHLSFYRSKDHTAEEKPQ